MDKVYDGAQCPGDMDNTRLSDHSKYNSVIQQPDQLLSCLSVVSLDYCNSTHSFSSHLVR